MKAGASNVWHPNTQMSEWDMFDSISGGDGVWLTDSKGFRMIDGVASMWCNVWGHSNREMVRAIARQAEKLQHSPLFNLTHEPAEKLARGLVGMSPGMHRVLYSENGSSAVETAVKVAFQYWTNEGDGGRTAIASLERGYHGDTLGAMSAGHVPEFFDRYRQHMFDAIELPVPVQGGMDCGGGGRGVNGAASTAPAPDALKRCIEGISDTLSARRGEVAAVIMESGAQMAGGVRIFEPSFQEEVSCICRENDTLLIVDEVATGFGRLGPMCVYSAERSKPDIVVYGKMLTGGYLPLAATLATRRVYESFLGAYDEQRHLFHGHTFAGNPIAAAAANKNLSMYKKYDMASHVSKASKVLADRIAEHLSGTEAVGEIRCRGLLAGIELAAGRGTATDTARPAASINRIIYEAGRRNGVYLRTLGNVVMLVPPLVITASEIDMLVERTAKTIGDATPSLQCA